MKYLGDIFKKVGKLPFLELFRELYLSGLKFALDNPKYISFSKKAFENTSLFHNEILKSSKDTALKYYTDFIEIDKKKGLIDKKVDTELLANLVIQITNNFTIETLVSLDKAFSDFLSSFISIFL